MILYCLLFIDIYDTEAYYSVSLFSKGSLFIVPLYFTISLSPSGTESVRLYSQKTWRVVTQTRGLQLVLEQHIHKVVSGVMGFSHAVKSLAIKV